MDTIGTDVAAAGGVAVKRVSVANVLFDLWAEQDESMSRCRLPSLNFKELSAG